jgi:hypothetical protein
MQIQAKTSDGVLEAGTPTLRTADALVTLTDFFAELVLVKSNLFFYFTSLILPLRSIDYGSSGIGRSMSLYSLYSYPWHLFVRFSFQVTNT